MSCLYGFCYPSFHCAQCHSKDFRLLHCLLLCKVRGKHFLLYLPSQNGSQAATLIKTFIKSDLRFSPKSHLERISDGVKYIHAHYCAFDFDYRQLSHICNISYTYFKKIFREIYKTTPSEYVKALRIQKACELLSTKRFSISQIAEMCGYENVYYFSKVFKDTVGISPSAYKKR